MDFDSPHPVVRPRGELTDGWRTVSFITWVLVGASVIAIAITSRTIGRATWWLGPESSPASPFLLVVPVAIIVVPLVVTSKSPRYISSTNIVCSALLLATALGDIGNSPAVAAGVIVVGVISMSVSIALLFVARQYR